MKRAEVGVLPGELPPSDHRYRLRLFVAGTNPQSVCSVRAVVRLFEADFADRYDLEVIDVYQQLSRAVADEIVTVPTLLKLAPPPVKRLQTNLFTVDDVRLGLGLPVPRPEGNG